MVHEMTRVFNVSREDLLKHAVETRQNLKELAKELAAVKRSAMIKKLGDLKGRSEEIHGIPTLMMLIPALGLAPRSLFDTELAARLLGRRHVGLAAVLEETLGLRLAKDHAAAD